MYPVPDCASAIANNPHTQTSASRPTVPMNLQTQMTSNLPDNDVTQVYITPASRTMSVTASKNHIETVRLWLLTAAAMIFLTLVVGGATGYATNPAFQSLKWKPVAGRFAATVRRGNGSWNSASIKPSRNTANSIAA